MTYRNDSSLRRAVRISVIALATLAIAACQTVGSDRRLSDAALAESALDNAEYTDAASIFEQLAQRSTATDQRRWQLAAALAWLDAGEAERARRLSGPLDLAATANDTDINAALIVAALAITDTDFATATAALDRLTAQPLTTRQNVRYQRWRAALLYAQGDIALATSYLTRRELWLTSERAVAANHQLIWDGLRDSDADAVAAALARTTDPTVRGWLELVLTTSPVRTNPAALASVVGAWTRRYPGHPANGTFVPALIGDDASALGVPRQVALLLPLSGRSRAFATAIRDGFLAAHIADLDSGDVKPRLRIYDVSGDGATLTVQRALDDGAEMIIGPLTKSALGELALQPALPVTTLGLNRIPADSVAPAGLYQFGLAPEDEARMAAERAIAVGYRRAVALAPLGDLGERLLTAFASHFQALGGQVLDYERYDTAATDFSAQIERVMQIQASISRWRRVQNLIGERAEFEPRRRQDVDVLFLPASARNARLLKPQLKFHFSGDIPVFATGQIANADGRESNEIAGIEYAEIPWLIDDSAAFTPSAADVASNWRREAQHQRLFALGMDAYRLIGPLSGAHSSATNEINGATGQLSIGSDGVIRRRLSWSRFNGSRGEALPVVPLDPALETDRDAWRFDQDQSGSE
ncbi:MAG: penicillin-binding protein activator [Pseudomonadota bacterium]